MIPVLALLALIGCRGRRGVASFEKLSAGSAAMPSMQELHTNKLPDQEIEDQSLIFPNRARPLATTGEAKR